MSDSFVPLFAKGANANDAMMEFSRLKVRTTPLVSAAPVPSVVGSPVVPSATPTHQNHGAPKVTLQKEGEKVTGIKIECVCGQVILLDCVY